MTSTTGQPSSDESATNTEDPDIDSRLMTPLRGIDDLIVDARYEVTMVTPAHSPDCCTCDENKTVVNADLLGIENGIARFEIPEIFRSFYRSRGVQTWHFEIRADDVTTLVAGQLHETYERTASSKVDRLLRGVDHELDTYVLRRGPVDDPENWKPISVHGSNLVIVEDDRPPATMPDEEDEQLGTLAFLHRFAVSEEADLFGWPDLSTRARTEARGCRLGVLVVPTEGPHVGRRCFANDVRMIRLAVDEDLERRRWRVREMVEEREEQRLHELAVAATLERYGLDELVAARSIETHASWHAGRTAAGQDDVLPKARIKLTPGELASLAQAIIDDPTRADLLVRETIVDTLS